MPRGVRKVNNKDQEIVQLKEQLEKWKVVAARSKAEENEAIRKLNLEKHLHRLATSRRGRYKYAFRRRQALVSKLNVRSLQLNADLNLFKSCSDKRTAKRLINEEHKLVIKYKKKMLEAQAVVRRRQEQTEQEKKPWRFCELCDMEFQDTGIKTPHVLYCGHTFCQECLVKIAGDHEIRNTLDAVNLRCPFDHRFTRGLSTEMNKLPKNFTVLHM
ncbi:hypothetical protein B9Z55_006731 [Caenorhabditis nigoni]|uniref:RING-type domain-containing protein n=1 Tax=Caenorhabditis nigoni TaxID=1611254 RepID=A0A2G5V748_9PELO|nr:hypothetical protein B9Z55_006731 [Caenorhabditis nigoni]